MDNQRQALQLWCLLVLAVIQAVFYSNRRKDYRDS